MNVGELNFFFFHLGMGRERGEVGFGRGRG